MLADDVKTERKEKPKKQGEKSAPRNVPPRVARAKMEGKFARKTNANIYIHNEETERRTVHNEARGRASLCVWVCVCVLVHFPRTVLGDGRIIF